MTPSLYDLLDVDESATAEEIRTAWKAAIADLDPTDRRFRAFNQAAETLLDPKARAAYDAELTGEPTAEEPEPATVVLEKEPEPEPEPDAEPEPEPAPEDLVEPAPISQRILIAAVVLAVLAVAGTVWIWTRPGAHDDPDRFDAREQGAQQAEAVAEDAIAPVLSYDYRRLDDDVARAAPYFTDDYAQDYRGLIEDLAPQAKKDKLVVSAQAVATGLVRSGDDRAEVLVFVDQASSRDGVANDPLRMWVTLTMVSDGDGWLIDKMEVASAVPS